MLPWSFSPYRIYFLHSGFLSNMRLRWKTELPWNFSLFWNSFIIQEFWATCTCPENRVCPEIFHWIETFFIIQDFEQLGACSENRICPENFQAGGRQPPPASYAYGIKDENTIILYCLENGNFKTAWISPVSTEWIVLVWLKNSGFYKFTYR